MKNSRIEIRVSEDEKERIDKFAEKENLKTATFIRKVTLDYMSEKKRLENMTDSELRDMNNAIESMIDTLDSELNEENQGYWMLFDYMTVISNQVTYEILARRKNKRR